MTESTDHFKLMSLIPDSSSHHPNSVNGNANYTNNSINNQGTVQRESGHSSNLSTLTTLGPGSIIRTLQIMGSNPSSTPTIIPSGTKGSQTVTLKVSPSGTPAVNGGGVANSTLSAETLMKINALLLQQNNATSITNRTIANQISLSSVNSPNIGTKLIQPRIVTLGPSLLQQPNTLNNNPNTPRGFVVQQPQNSINKPLSSVSSNTPNRIYFLPQSNAVDSNGSGANRPASKLPLPRIPTSTSLGSVISNSVATSSLIKNVNNNSNNTIPHLFVLPAAQARGLQGLNTNQILGSNVFTPKINAFTTLKNLNNTNNNNNANNSPSSNLVLLRCPTTTSTPAGVKTSHSSTSQTPNNTAPFQYIAAANNNNLYSINAKSNNITRLMTSMPSNNQIPPVVLTSLAHTAIHHHNTLQSLSNTSNNNHNKSNQQLFAASTASNTPKTPGTANALYSTNPLIHLATASQNGYQQPNLYAPYQQPPASSLTHQASYATNLAPTNNTNNNFSTNQSINSNPAALNNLLNQINNSTNYTANQTLIHGPPSSNNNFLQAAHYYNNNADSSTYREDIINNSSHKTNNNQNGRQNSWTPHQHHRHHNGIGGSSDRAGKGLRHFSMKVCEKVHRKGVTTYNEVADELVAEYTLTSFFNNAAAAAYGASPGASITPNGGTGSASFLAKPVDENALNNFAYDHKNIRRRVYDALNVLMAMNIISKEKKEIRWIGLPTNATQECAHLTREKEKRQQRIREKQSELNKLLLKQIALKNLIEKSKEENANMNSSDFNLKGHEPTLSLPFILISTDKSTIIDCSISNDKCEYYFNFNSDFEVFDDFQILKKLNLMFGLEEETFDGNDNANILANRINGEIEQPPNGKGARRIDENSLNKALSMVPRVMHPHVKRLAGYAAFSETEYVAPDIPSLINPANMHSVNNDNNNKILGTTFGYPQPSHDAFSTSHTNVHPLENIPQTSNYSLLSGLTTSFTPMSSTQNIKNNNLLDQTLTMPHTGNNVASNSDEENKENKDVKMTSDSACSNDLAINKHQPLAVSLATLQFKNLLNNRALLLQQQLMQQQQTSLETGLQANKLGDKAVLSSLANINKMSHLSNQSGHVIGNPGMIVEKSASSTSTSELFSSEDSVGSSQSQNSSSGTSFGCGGV